MEYVKVAGIDKPVSRMVFGTDRLRSRRLWWLPDRSLEDQAFTLSARSFELGCNTFDATRIYRYSEQTHGTWMRKRRNRGKVVDISKGCHPDRLGRPRLSASDVSHDLHASLKALGTDSIDLHLLHYDHTTARVEPAMEQRNRHIEEGKITATGASSWSHERAADPNAVAASQGLKPFCASSVQFSLADWTRSPWRGAVTFGGEGQRAAREWYSTPGLSAFARSSLGFLSHRYGPNNPYGNPVSRWCATYFSTEENIQRLERAVTLARDRHVSVAQVALAYKLCHPLHVFAVVGCTTIENFSENVRASSLTLDAATLQLLATGQAAR